jgi:hypothetical protein
MTVYGLKPDFYGNLVVQQLDQPSRTSRSTCSTLICRRCPSRLGSTWPRRLGGAGGHDRRRHRSPSAPGGAPGLQHLRERPQPSPLAAPEPGQGVIAGLVVDARDSLCPSCLSPFSGRRAEQVVAPDPDLRRLAESPRRWATCPATTKVGRELCPGPTSRQETTWPKVTRRGAKSYVQPTTVGHEPAWDEIAFVRLITTDRGAQSHEKSRRPERADPHGQGRPAVPVPAPSLEEAATASLDVPHAAAEGATPDIFAKGLLQGVRPRTG